MSLSATPTVRAASSAAAATGSGTQQHQQQQHRKSQDRQSDPCVDKAASTVISAQESPVNAAIATRQSAGQSMASGVGPATRTRPTRTAKRRHKVKEFNEVISCYLCSGYLVNATTVDYCVHSYCRSCIVKHLQEDKHCPQCRPGGKQISLSNLKTDERLKSIVYKLVPGLFQNEHQKQVQFYSDTSAARGEDQDEALLDSDEDYFSPVEPISLSLEYHPKCLQGCEKQQIPPIRYLQCPAAVTVHHLKRFISSKFDIDPDNARVDIEIIYEDEILPEDFSLMDVGYCYSWKRVAPMRFFYRILVHNLCNTSSQVIPSDSVLSESDSVVEAKRAKKSNEAGTQKTVRFKDVKQSTEKPTGTTVQEESKKPTEKEAETKYTIFKTKSIKCEEVKEVIAISNNNNNNNNSTKADHNVSSKPTEIEPPPPPKDDAQINGGFGPVKMTINMKKSNEARSKHPDGSSKSKSKSKTASASAAGTDDIPMTVINDFKSLRSNDQKYNDYSVSSISTSKSKCSASKAKPAHKDASNKPQSKADTSITIPKPHSHRASVSSSDDSLENLSLAQLKTANKKPPPSSVVSKPNISSEVSSKSQKKEEKEKHRAELPKLKIELPSLKTKITVPKKSPEVVEPKKSPKVRKSSNEEIQSPPVSNQVDLTTYAKNIGLKPIKPAAEESAEKKEAKPVISPDKSPFSTSSSNSSPPSSSGSAFIFSADGAVASSHKKRKKAKHSKEPGSGKRRKLHAEISSQPAEESLKLKVKITGNHKLYKSEKKSSSSSTPEDVAPTPFVTLAAVSSSSPSVTTTSAAIPSVKIIAPKPSQESSATAKSPAETKHGVRNNLSVNIPNLNKTLSEESTNINNLISENSSPKQAEQSPLTTGKAQTFCKPKPAMSSGPKTIPMVSVPLTTIAQMTMSNNGSANQPKAMPVKILSIQETKIPVSPPLPPSLFKTTPMSLQTMTSTPSKQPVMQSPAKTSPQQTEVKSTAMAQLKRLAGSAPVRPQGNFAVPNPPRSTGMTRHGPITSIASAAHRQAQLKRSASLDSNPANFTKQQKLDHDRAVRKSAYAPFLMQNSAAQGTTSTATSGNSNSQAASGVKTQKTSSPVISSSSNSTKSVKVTEQQSFYTSAMAPSYTHELVSRKSTSVLLSAPTLSMAKMPDIVAPKMSYSTPAVTITPQQQPLPPTPYQQQQQQKPALEIVRISSNIPPIDQQQLTITNNNTVKQTPQKTTRPPPPPIPLVKIKRTASQPTPLKATLTTVSPPVQQAQISSNAKTSPPVPITTASDTTITAVPNKVQDAPAANDKPASGETNGPLDLSGKSSRSPSQEKTSPAVSPPDTPTPNSVKDTQAIKRQMANNLEAALNKLKQQNSITTISSSVSSTQATSTTFAPSVQTVKSPVTPEAPVVSTSGMTLNVPKLTESSSGLQNLKLLSDSATIREKLTLKNQRSLPMLPKLNEINKMRTNPPVRQQNASVRNIPNPSALAFRSHHQMPMLASITKTTSPQKSTAITTSATTTTPSSTLSFLNSSDKGLESTTPATSSHVTVSMPSSVSKSDVVTTTVSSSSSAKMSTVDPPKIVAPKKNIKSIDQLAANLNLRAAAAAIADSALKASATSTALSSNTTTETTTSSTTEAASSKAVSPSSTTATIPATTDTTTGTTALTSGAPILTGGPVAVTSSTPAPISASTA